MEPTAEELQSGWPACTADLPLVRRQDQDDVVGDLDHWAVTSTLTRPHPQEQIGLGNRRRPSMADQVPRKRRRSAAAAHDRTDEGECHDQKDDTITFSCPFFRNDPIHYMDCITLKLTRIRDVKQHIQRRHAIAAFCCPVCCQGFDSVLQRDCHIRLRNCEPQEHGTRSIPNNVSLELLKGRVDRTLSPPEQWYSVWDILFQGTPRPPSPYLGSLVEELIRMMRGFWKEEGQRIIPDLLRASGRPTDDGNLSDFLLGVFDEVQVQFGQRFRDANVSHRRLSLTQEDIHPPTTSIADTASATAHRASTVLGTFLSEASESSTWGPPACEFPETIEKSHQTQGLGDGHTESNGLVLGNLASDTALYHHLGSQRSSQSFDQSALYNLTPLLPPWELLNQASVSHA